MPSTVLSKSGFVFMLADNICGLSKLKYNYNSGETRTTANLHLPCRGKHTDRREKGGGGGSALGGRDGVGGTHAARRGGGGDHGVHIHSVLVALLRVCERQLRQIERQSATRMSTGGNARQKHPAKHWEGSERGDRREGTEHASNAQTKDAKPCIRAPHCSCGRRRLDAGLLVHATHAVDTCHPHSIVILPVLPTRRSTLIFPQCPPVLINTPPCHSLKSSHCSLSTVSRLPTPILHKG